MDQTSPEVTTMLSFTELQAEHARLTWERDQRTEQVQKLESELPEAFGNAGWVPFSDFRNEALEIIAKSDENIKRWQDSIVAAQATKKAYQTFLDEKLPEGVAHIIMELRRRQRAGEISTCIANNAVKALEAASGLREHELK